MKKLEEVKYLIVHHTGRTIDFPLFIKIRHIFLRRWEDIGYHFLITTSKVCKGREEHLQGAHTYRYNQNSIGICIIGDFNERKPSEKQLKTLCSFLAQKAKEYGVKSENILGHKELPGVNKDCPGKNIEMNKIRSIVDSYLSQN